MEMQSRSRYVWISSKEPPAGSIYASRFRIMERPGVPANWVVVMRRTAPADGTCRLTFFPYIPPAYIAQPASSLHGVIFPFLSFDTKDSDLADRMTFYVFLYIPSPKSGRHVTLPFKGIESPPEIAFVLLIIFQVSISLTAFICTNIKILSLPVKI